jgi:hypothetical protein
MIETPGGKQAQVSKQQQQTISNTNRRAILIGILGAVATGSALAAIAGWSVTSVAPNPTPNPTLAEIAPAELEIAKATLTGNVFATSQQTGCPTPLAYVTIWTTESGSNGTVQVQSGNYISPSFQPSTAPKRIAIPFPAPYLTGTGIIGVRGIADGLMVALSPVWGIGSLTGKIAHKVVWTPNAKC